VTSRLGDEGGFSLIELLVVTVILGTVLGGITALFASGINADADQNRRFQAQQSARLTLDKMRREVHAACTVSNPGTYNTWEASITLYFASDSCASGANTVTWCTAQLSSPPRYALFRNVGTTCGAANTKWADYLTNPTPFVYLPPNSHVLSLASLGAGASGTYIATSDGSSSLPRLHVDMTINLNSSKHDGYRLYDDIAFRNGPRACGSGVASC
jgi:prepilin-type N-terminal cleavage/methylation domain-containing protein